MVRLTVVNDMNHQSSTVPFNRLVVPEDRKNGTVTTPLAGMCIASKCAMWRLGAGRLTENNLKKDVVSFDVGRSVKGIGLSVRTENSLLSYEINFVKDLLGQTRNGLRRIPNVGARTIKEIEAVLLLHGLELESPAKLFKVKTGYCGLAGKP